MVQKKQITNTFISKLKKTFPKKTFKKVVKLTKQLKNKTSKYANVVKRKTENAAKKINKTILKAKKKRKTRRKN